MRRGISQEQVDTAADAILAAGRNPTVEKVRAQLGTGSPNTIVRMLDVWRSRVGERLRQVNAVPELPPDVGQAMAELWQLAVEHAGRALADRFTHERAALEAEVARLTQERAAWEAQLTTARTQLAAAQAQAARAQAERDLAEHACANLDSQLQDGHALRADLVEQRDRLQGICDRQSEELERLRDRL